MQAAHHPHETIGTSDPATRPAHAFRPDQVEWLEKVRALLAHQETFADKLQLLLAQSQAASTWDLARFIASEESRISAIAQELLDDPSAADALATQGLRDLAACVGEIAATAADASEQEGGPESKTAPSPAMLRGWLDQAARVVRPLLLRLDLVLLSHAVQQVMEHSHLDEEALVRELSAHASK